MSIKTKKIFLQLILSEETDYLLFQKPKAFQLLTIVARRARREDGKPDGLKPGQCYLGDWKKCGLTEQEYRTAKDILVMRQHLKIVETCRTRKKSTTGVTTIGTLVELISSNVYDLNIKSGNDRNNDRATTEQRPSNDELIKKEDINKKNEGTIKKAIREWVFLTEIEIETFFHTHGSPLANQMLDILDSYNTSRQECYKSDYGALKTNGWVHKEALKRNAPATPYNSAKVDRRTKNIDGTPVSSPADGRF